MAQKETGAENVRWDLSPLYLGLDDPQLNKDIEAVVRKARNLDLKRKTNISDATVKAKIFDVNRIFNQSHGEYLTFFAKELIALEDTVLEELYASNPIVARHRPWIEYGRIFKPHILSELVESALIKRSSFGPEAWSEFFDELEADLEFEFRGSKKTLTEMLHISMESKDQEERFEAMSLINNGFKGVFAKYAAQTLHIITGYAGVDDRERSYDHPMESTNIYNRTSDSTVDALHRAVKDVAGPLARRFYRLKAAHLGIEILKWSDRNAPMLFSDNSFVPFDEAIKIVLAAYKSFSPTLAYLAENSIVKANCIDAPAMKGKVTGAMNVSIVLPEDSSISFILLNFLGSNEDVTTLAHELGHGVHGLLAGKKQGHLMFQAPTALCETASIFGEITTFNLLKDRLIKKGDKRSLLALVMSGIDGLINQTVMQIGFSNLERRIHGMNSSYDKWNNPKKLSTEELNKIWLETLKSLYGEEGEIFTYENTEYLWAYISHFHTPFYVYSYAFGRLLAQSIYACQPRLGDKFEPLCLNMLGAGNTKNAVELLEPFGLDPTDEKFWIDGINDSLGKMIREAEQLSYDMNVFI